ncbi:MAG: N-acetylmuramoyl-L-alanine amidase [Gemella sp.]|nr:N-acetylmuramoyl-L-alanine amidase [Gemella sp.]
MNKKLLMSLAIFSSTFVASELANLNEAEASTKKVTTYKLNNSAKTYANAVNAQTGKNASKKIYAAGNYYVYKTATNGMINISTQQGKPGAWINPNTGAVVSATKNTTSVTKNTATSTPKTPATKPVTPTENQIKATTYKLNGTVATYANAANAQTGKNASKKTYAAGNYYVYKTASNGMINISTQQGKPGAWINPNSAKAPASVSKTATPTKTTSTVVQKPAAATTKTESTPATYKLSSAVQTYANAANAKAEVNSKKTYAAGNYYVYKTATNGMINISKTPGKVGAWINPNATNPKAAATEPKKETTKQATTEKPATKTVAQSIVAQDKGSNSGVRNNYGKYSKVIYLDAGHGAADSGAAYFGQKEKDLNLSIYKKLTTQLQKEGYTIKGTRNSDTFTKLQDISAKANQTDADLFVSIHFNASSSSAAKGIETYWYQDYKEYPTKINQDNHLNPDRLRRSEILANGIHSNLIKNTGAVDRGVRRDTYSVLRETAIPAVLLELGYMSNRDEATKIGQSSYQDKLVDGIVKGINNYYQKA